MHCRPIHCFLWFSRYRPGQCGPLLGVGDGSNIRSEVPVTENQIIRVCLFWQHYFLQNFGNLTQSVVKLKASRHDEQELLATGDTHRPRASASLTSPQHVSRYAGHYKCSWEGSRRSCSEYLSMCEWVYRICWPTWTQLEVNLAAWVRSPCCFFSYHSTSSTLLPMSYIVCIFWSVLYCIWIFRIYWWRGQILRSVQS